jgi:perosamine synthetase
MSSTDLPKQALAIHGGTSVRKTNLPYGRQGINEDDIEAVVQVLRSDWITTGPKVDEFEEAVAEFVGAKFAVSFSSGTAALHGAAFAAGLSDGDDAITTPLTFCATANCVLYMGATPVFADVCPDTLNIDPEEAAKHITSRTKAILPVDYAGHPAEIDEILALAEKYNLVVIEDAAHALGARYKKQRVGRLSHMTTFSFHPVKHITTGEGGMVTTDDPELASQLRLFRNHGIDLDARRRQASTDGPWYYEMTELGFNYRLPDIACALGTSQLRKLPENVKRRQEIADHYSKAFSDLSGVLPPIERPDISSAWHIYPIRLQLDRLTAGRREVFEALRAENIGVNVHYIPVHLHPYYRARFGFRGGEYPIAEDAYERLITLPLFHGMTDLDMNDVVTAVNKIIAYYQRP